MSDDRELDERTTQRVLERAMELDVAAGEKLKAAQIRTIAAELGISTGAIEQALAEQASTLAPSTSPAPQPKRGLSRWFVRASMATGIAAVVLVVLSLILRLFP